MDTNTTKRCVACGATDTTTSDLYDYDGPGSGTFAACTDPVACLAKIEADAAERAAARAQGA